MADLLAPVRALFGARSDTAAPSIAVPSVAAWTEAVRAEQPPDYERQVTTALSYYYGHSGADTLATLRKLFPRSAEKISLVTLDVLRLVVDEQARVFAGNPGFGLVSPDGAPVAEEALAIWQGVLDGAELHRKLIEADRLTRACRRYFVRVTWDARAQQIKLTLFAPTKAYPRFATDRVGDLDAGEGVLLEVAPRVSATGQSIKRWEFWSAGSDPRNLIVDERGGVERGENGGLNEYTDDEGNPIVPIAAFADCDEDAGYWQPPSEALVTAQRTVNAQASNVFHVAQHQGFGQWVFETTDPNPEPWAGSPGAVQSPNTKRDVRRSGGGGAAELAMGPETPLVAPKGWSVTHVAQQAPLDLLMSNLLSYLRQVAISERVPPSSLIADSQVLSGVALAVSRIPLAELRRDRIAIMTPATLRLLNVVRRVYEQHNPGTLGAYRATFKPGEIVLPADPAQAAAQRAADLRDGLTSAARLLAERDGISLDEAKTLAAEIQAEQRGGRATAATLAAGLRERVGQG